MFWKKEKKEKKEDPRAEVNAVYVMESDSPFDGVVVSVKEIRTSRKGVRWVQYGYVNDGVVGDVMLSSKTEEDFFGLYELREGASQ